MTVASIEELCAGFCEIVQQPAPPLAAGDDGTTAFNLEWRGVTVDVMHLPHRSRHHVFIMFDMGPIEREGIAPARIMQALLEANFFSLRAVPLAFGRHPLSGAAVLQRALTLDFASPTALLETIEEGVDLALQWREDAFLT